MKSLFLAALASVASAHYVFPAVIHNGVTTPDWTNVRQWTTYYTYGPVTDVTSLDIRCNVGGTTTKIGTNTTTVNAGDTLGFTVEPTSSGLYHPGPLIVYMAKAPSGTDVATWDGSGSVWFKIFEAGPTSFNASGPVWPYQTGGVTGVDQVFFTLPKALPTADYLLRIEHIAVHNAATVNGAQFYLSCAQLNVQNGGSGKPTPTVSFPGAYTPTDPGILYNLYSPWPQTTYVVPGPSVWTG
ncbi:lytic polysaccharide monooxygenase [Viridothelium virens]|uniref:lytic cellulose monooxygenase (C4-dehydrogenating) n=1 Tax=Viridothelium virens TaxID=1048519 RepID=A0A6A6H667_VIRVR|nr:lytic polysaccharide monooxygenase [Viridothelium virens]